MQSIDKNLKSKLLPTALVFKKYVNGEPKCNYEMYLREMLNLSKYFRSLSDGKEYEEPTDEDHGECDAITSRYEIDFKLVESSSYLEAKRQYSTGIQVICEGVIASTVPARNGSTYVTNLHCALRDINSYEQIEDILRGEYAYIKMNKRTVKDKDMQLNADLKDFYNNLVIDKNLLLYIPEIFYFEDECYQESDAIEIVRQALKMDFAFSCQYRSCLRLEKDAFICCIYSDAFLIFKFMDNDFLLVDKIPVGKSSIYMDLYRRYGALY